MSLLQNGQHLQTTDGQRVVVEKLIAAGGQGEVYQVNVEGKRCAMKWYHIPANPEQGERALKQKEKLWRTPQWDCSTLLLQTAIFYGPKPWFWTQKIHFRIYHGSFGTTLSGFGKIGIGQNKTLS